MTRNNPLLNNSRGLNSSRGLSGRTGLNNNDRGLLDINKKKSIFKLMKDDILYDEQPIKDAEEDEPIPSKPIPPTKPSSSTTDVGASSSSLSTEYSGNDAWDILYKNNKGKIGYYEFIELLNDKNNISQKDINEYINYKKNAIGEVSYKASINEQERRRLNEMKKAEENMKKLEPIILSELEKEQLESDAPTSVVEETEQEINPLDYATVVQKEFDDEKKRIEEEKKQKQITQEQSNLIGKLAEIQNKYEKYYFVKGKYDELKKKLDATVNNLRNIDEKTITETTELLEKEFLQEYKKDIEFTKETLNNYELKDIKDMCKRYNELKNIKEKINIGNSGKDTLIDKLIKAMNNK